MPERGGDGSSSLLRLRTRSRYVTPQKHPFRPTFSNLRRVACEVCTGRNPAQQTRHVVGFHRLSEVEPLA